MQLSRFPAVDRDFSFVFADTVTFDQIHSAVTIAEDRGTAGTFSAGGNITRRRQLPRADTQCA